MLAHGFAAGEEESSRASGRATESLTFASELVHSSVSRDDGQVTSRPLQPTMESPFRNPDRVGRTVRRHRSDQAVVRVREFDPQDLPQTRDRAGGAVPAGAFFAETVCFQSGAG